MKTTLWVIGTVVVIGGASAAIYFLVVKPANKKVGAANANATQAEANASNALLQTINGKTKYIADEYVKAKGNASKIYGLSNEKIIAIYNMLQVSKFSSPEAIKAAIFSSEIGVNSSLMESFSSINYPLLK